MKKLIVESEAGMAAAGRAEKALEAVCKKHPVLSYIVTDPGKPAAIDGVFFVASSHELAALVEVKCREMTKKQLVEKYNNRWLLSHHKVETGRKLSKMLSLPLVGLMVLVPDRMALLVNITNSKGDLVADIYTKQTETTETMEGGKEIRNCDFICMNGAKEYKL